jgi:small Trp-rich protein
MWFVVLGVALLVMNWTGIGPPANWNFNLTGDMWKFAWPFVAAIAWWSFSDSTGRTQRKAMERMQERKEDRRDKALEALGLGFKSRKGKRQREVSRNKAANLEGSQDRDLGRREDRS